MNIEKKIDNFLIEEKEDLESLEKAYKKTPAGEHGTFLYFKLLKAIQTELKNSKARVVELETKLEKYKKIFSKD